MQLLNHMSMLLASLSLAYAHPRSLRAALPPCWILAGDSTTAPNGGWGDAFLNTTLSNGASGVNLAKSGATTTSFRAEGRWSSVLTSATAYKSNSTVYVTIQFGHNDQKSTSGVNTTQFQANLETFVNQAKTAGATPVLVTSLTRRAFNSTTDKVIENLAEQRSLTIAAAKKTGSWWIDLNEASTEYVNAIGEEASHEYNLTPDDNTHLNAWGGVVFARLVSDLLVEKYPVLKEWTRANETLSEELKDGVAA